MITNQTERLNFASTKNIPQYPDFLDVQVKSFKDFFQLETKSDERGDEGFVQYLHGKLSNYRHKKQLCIRIP